MYASITRLKHMKGADRNSNPSIKNLSSPNPRAPTSEKLEVEVIKESGSEYKRRSGVIVRNAESEILQEIKIKEAKGS